jgi:hypothetical protein
MLKLIVNFVVRVGIGIVASLALGRVDNLGNKGLVRAVEARRLFNDVAIGFG